MLEKHCRLCAREKPLLIHIFDDATLEKNIPVKIQINLGITVSENDTLPHNICFLCLEKLEAFNNFVESCQSCQVYLNELHSQCSDIENIDLKSSSVDDNVVEVVFVDNEMYESKCTINSSSLKAIDNEIEIVPCLRPKKNIQNTTNVTCINAKLMSNQAEFPAEKNTSDEEWEIYSEEQHDGDEVESDKLVENAVNAVFNLVKREMHMDSDNFNKGLVTNGCKNEETEYNCPLCPSKFNRKGNLRQHLSIHSGVKPFKCEDCSLAFLRRQHLTRHKRVHSGEKPFSCDMCGSSFTRKTSMRKHIENHLAAPKVPEETSTKSQQFTEIPADDVGDKQFMCNLCGASFARRNYVLQHAIVHATERPYVCSICSYSFARPQHLSRHMMIHLDIKPYKCNFCDSSFSRRSYQQRHEKIHFRDNEFEKNQKESTDKEVAQCTCEICGNSFSDIKYLRQHYKTHSAEKPFECHHCGSAFRRKHHLRRHVLIHTGEKPFLCSICGASFARKFYLKVHSVTHSSEKPYVCKICGNAFSRNSSLRQHMKTHVYIRKS